jgi:hypothetical protein
MVEKPRKGFTVTVSRHGEDEFAELNLRRHPNYPEILRSCVAHTVPSDRLRQFGTICRGLKRRIRPIPNDFCFHPERFKVSRMSGNHPIWSLGCP